jgi:CheY-like chemotaxis protein
MSKQSDGMILVVDDDALSRRMLVRSPYDGNYTCHETNNDIEAWDNVQAETHSLLFLDF